jgi:GNAT superfamily N-acetyltransferase
VRKSGWEHDVASRERFCDIVARRGNWLVRPYAQGDEIEIAALCEKILGSTLTLEKWRWRNLQNPAGEAVVFVAEEKEARRLVGHIAAIPTDLKVGDFSRKGFFLVDSAIDPSHRGKGIHAVLTLAVSKESCMKDGGFGFGLPNNQAYLPTLKSGAIELFTLSLFLKVLDWRKVLRARLRSAFLTNTVGAFIQLLQKKRRTRSCDDFRIEEVARFGDQVNDLWQRIAPRFAILASRKATPLNWRYFERPNSPYRVFSISRSGRWQGYVVIRILEKWGLRLGTLVDLFFDPDCAPAGELLLCRAERELRSNGADALWGLFTSPQPYRKLFRDAGFFKAPQLRGLRRFHFVADFVTVECLRPDLDARDGALLRQGDQWFLSLGDTDLA